LLTAWDDNVVCFWFECCVRHFTTMSLLFIIFYSLEDSLEVLGDNKCFVVVYFELTKIEVVLPFYFLPFTFILSYIFRIFVLYCIACTVCDVVLWYCCLCFLSVPVIEYKYKLNKICMGVCARARVCARACK
jgi:hypothetical protein